MAAPQPGLAIRPVAGLQNAPDLVKRAVPDFGIWQPPVGQLLGAKAQIVLPANPRRRGAWLWAQGQSVNQAGNQAAPTAGQRVTPLLALTPGVWDLFVTLTFVAGAPVATDSINWQLLLGPMNVAGAGVQVGGGPLASPAALNQSGTRSVRVVVPEPANIVVAAVANATAGVTYQAEIVATPAEPVLVGLDGGVGLGSLGAASGWAVGPFPAWLETEQEIWGVSITATQAAELRVWEVFKTGRPLDAPRPLPPTRPGP